MATRSYADVPPTAATIALNAYIYGYGGHSLVTPHAALKQLWWTDKRIEAKVTRSFVISKLRGEERGFLDRPLAFGEGLTDDTYMEWILERAKRLFLILAEIGVPDQIFGCIDDSWDDDDLPISLENVRTLELAYENDEALNRKFYDTQFVYLLRELKQGAHIDYGPKEHIPMEYVNTLPPAVSLQSWDRIHFPGRPEEIYQRRRYSLTDKEHGQNQREQFMKDVRKARSLGHEHVANVWASYTSDGSGYILSDFVAEHTLGTFIDHRTPAQLLRVAASRRPVLLCEWMHCLATALASLHNRGAAHTAIRPSNIWIDKDNRIAFADIGTHRTFQRGKKPHKTEAYDYSAPESQISQSFSFPAPSSPPSSMSTLGKLRKMSSSGGSSSSSSTGSGTRTNSMCSMSSPITPPSSGRSNSMTTITNAFSPRSHLPRSSTSSSFRNFSRLLHHQPCPSPSIPTSPNSVFSGMSLPFSLPHPSYIDPDTLQDLPQPAPEMSDVYSLACIFLDIVTFMIKGKLNDFVRFRSTRVSAPSSKRSVRLDHSFHCDPDKIDAWMEILKHDSARLNEQVFQGVPELLRLIRLMMAQNALLRPAAQEVRDRLQEILVSQCGVDSLCCAGREWETYTAPDLTIDNVLHDAYGVASGMLTPPSAGFKKQRSSDGSISGDSVIGNSQYSSFDFGSKRRSSASSVTPTGGRMSAWKRAFTRSA